jgi:hypothetical protein
MAGQRFSPAISTNDVIFLGEALNYNTLMPHGAKYDPQLLIAVDRAVMTVSGALAIGATKIVLVAKILNSTGIPSGTTLTFGATQVVTSAWTSPDSKEILVFPIPAAIADATVCTYAGIGARPLYAGTLVGRTYAQRDAGVMFHNAVDADEEIYIVAFDIPDALRTNEISLIRPQTRIKENRLPGFSSLSATLKTKVRTLYQCYRGT